ncbi:AAA family ATPase [Candidatus Saccharibacteria bacterium]|nr:AAA family ATPase [Candidatus Saccharibacteria bacterium]
MEIIGISGPPCSGKDVAAEYLSLQFGFNKISSGDLLRAKARELNISLGRTSLQLLGTRLREENDGIDPLLDCALKDVSGDTVFTGIRTVDAAQAIMDTEKGRLIYIDAPLEDRYQRSLTRARGDHSSFDEFIEQDSVEHNGALNIDTSLGAIKAISSKIIYNDSTLDYFLCEIEEIIIRQ